MTTKKNSQELKTQIDNYICELAEATDQARQSDAMQSYLNFCARFHQYSPHNILLIRMTHPAATHVAGFQAWKKLDRIVRKGSAGIPILAPVLVMDQNQGGEDKKLVGFRTAHVFDVSQTKGSPLPPIPDWKSPEQNLVLNQFLVRFAQAKGIKVTFTELERGIQGRSKGGEIEIDPQAGSKTLIHEIAHEMMHQDNPRMLKQVVELEAEAVAYVVGRFFRLTGLSSPNYIALHRANKQLVLAHMIRIQRAAHLIIGHVDDERKRLAKLRPDSVPILLA